MNGLEGLHAIQHLGVTATPYVVIDIWDARGPLAPCSTWNSSSSPSARESKDPCGKALEWKKISSPFSARTKPNPRSRTSFFTTPFTYALLDQNKNKKTAGPLVASHYGPPGRPDPRQATLPLGPICCRGARLSREKHLGFEIFAPATDASTEGKASGSAGELPCRIGLGGHPQWFCLPVRRTRTGRRGFLAVYGGSISSGPLAAINNTIKLLQRMGFGCRDDEFFKLRIVSLP